MGKLVRRNKYYDIPQGIYDLDADIHLLLTLAEYVNLEECIPESQYQEFILLSLLVILKSHDTAEKKLINVRFFIDNLNPLQ